MRSLIPDGHTRVLPYLETAPCSTSAHQPFMLTSPHELWREP